MGKPHCSACGFSVLVQSAQRVGHKDFLGGRRSPAFQARKARRCVGVETRDLGVTRRGRDARWKCIDVGFLGAFEEVLELLIATAVVVPLFKRVNLSPVLGFLAAGVALGPHGFGLVKDIDDISQIAEIGVLFLLFEMGLELSVDRLKRLRTYAFGLGNVQMAVTTAALSGGAYLMGAGISESLVIGSSLSLSSSAFVLQLLAERNEKSTTYATATFGVLLLQDIAVVPLLVLVPLLAKTQWQDVQEIEALVVAVGITAVKALGAILGVVVVGGFVLRPIFKFVSESNSAEAFTSIVLATVLGAGFVTDELGLSMTLGAFIAGILLSESSFRTKIEVDIEPFRGLLLGLFFITTGMSMDITLLFTKPLQLFVLITSLIAVKSSILTAVSLPFGLTPAEATRVGLILGQGGEFSFVLFALANKLGYLPNDVYEVLIVVVVSTMALTPALAELAGRLAPTLQQATSSTNAIADGDEETRPRKPAFVQENTVIIVGFGPVGRLVADMLSRKFIPFIAVDDNPQIVEDAITKGIPCVQADATSSNFLSNAGIKSPTAVVLTMTSSRVAVASINAVQSDYPSVPIYTRAHDLRRMRLLTNLGVVATYPEAFETSLALGDEVLRGYGIPEQDVTAISTTLRKERGFQEIWNDNDLNRKDSYYRRQQELELELEGEPPQRTSSKVAIIKVEGEIETRESKNLG